MTIEEEMGEKMRMSEVLQQAGGTLIQIYDEDRSLIKSRICSSLRHPPPT